MEKRHCAKMLQIICPRYRHYYKDTDEFYVQQIIGSLLNVCGADVFEYEKLSEAASKDKYLYAQIEKTARENNEDDEKKEKLKKILKMADKKIKTKMNLMV